MWVESIFMTAERGITVKVLDHRPISIQIIST